MRRVSAAVLSILLLSLLTGCGGATYHGPSVAAAPPQPDPPAPDQPVDSDEAAGDLGVDRCGNYTSEGVGVKVESFLRAAAVLGEAISDANSHVRLACKDLGERIGMAGGALDGDTKAVCHAVTEAINAELHASLAQSAALTITYHAAECTANDGAAARARTRCERNQHSRRSGDKAMSVCDASAGAAAVVAARCTPATVSVVYDAGDVTDKDRLDRLAGALRDDLSKLAVVYAQLASIQKAFMALVASTADLKNAIDHESDEAFQSSLISKGLGALEDDPWTSSFRTCVIGLLQEAGAAGSRATAAFNESMMSSAEIGTAAGATM